MEYCTAMLRRPEEHDRLWELLVAARSQADCLKQQLKVGAAALTFLGPSHSTLTSDLLYISVLYLTLLPLIPDLPYPTLLNSTPLCPDCVVLLYMSVTKATGCIRQIQFSRIKVWF